MTTYFYHKISWIMLHTRRADFSCRWHHAIRCMLTYYHFRVTNCLEHGSNMFLQNIYYCLWDYSFLIQKVAVFNIHCYESVRTSISRSNEYLLVQVMKFACQFSNTNIFVMCDWCPLYTVWEHFWIANTSMFSNFIVWSLC